MADLLSTVLAKALVLLAEAIVTRLVVAMIRSPRAAAA
ncbi:hypothetical protein IW256_005922 [Actinomadura viridis]|uniref:Uncharacterized protein n=1 Tax=Actinomadura viridis TaxID=58110 RepID=A0A931DNC3_9ACTN|nr:hypothetical protein [Actinomadura viridis]